MVYLVIEMDAYEKTTIYGVFSTREGAEEYVRDWVKIRPSYRRFHDLIIQPEELLA
jgi:hypothetical protein